MVIARRLSMIAAAGIMMAWGFFGSGFTVTPAEATRVRGGEWCTEHVAASTCSDCRPVSGGNSTKCLNSSGTKWNCQNSTTTACQECILGSPADCQGQGAFWNNGTCNGQPALTLNNCSGIQFNPDSFSNIAPGTCPNNCPASS